MNYSKGKKVLKQNPVIGLVSLSAPEQIWSPDVYNKGKEELLLRGFTCIEPSNVAISEFYMSGTPDMIADSLHQVFMNPDVDVVMCMGGGTNMNKILPHIDYGLLKENMKPFIGISNITALMMAMAAHNMVSFHGPFVLWSYGLPDTPTEYTHKNMVESLRGFSGNVTKKTQWGVLQDGSATGRVIGGNVWTLGTVIGTKYCPVELFEGSILILEDICESFDRIDAVITKMRLLGILDRIQGVVCGKFSECSAPENVDMSLSQFLSYAFRGYSYPIIYDCDFGHVPDNLCLPIGCIAKISASDDVEFCLLEEGVV